MMTQKVRTEYRQKAFFGSITIRPHDSSLKSHILEDGGQHQITRLMLIKEGRYFRRHVLGSAGLLNF